MLAPWREIGQARERRRGRTSPHLLCPLCPLPGDIACTRKEWARKPQIAGGCTGSPWPQKFPSLPWSVITMGRVLILPDIEPAKHLLVFLGKDPSQHRA